MAEKFDLSWSDFKNHTSNAFRDLLEHTDFVDVTLACEEDKHVTAHKIILSACSPFFRNILQRNHHQRPLIFLDGVKHRELIAIIDFIYLGRAEVSRDGIEEFMRVGRKLKITGLVTEIDSINHKDQSKPKEHEQKESSLIFNNEHEKMETVDNNVQGETELETVEGKGCLAGNEIEGSAAETDLLQESEKDTMAEEKDLLEEIVMPPLGNEAEEGLKQTAVKSSSEKDIQENVKAKDSDQIENIRVPSALELATETPKAVENTSTEISDMLKGDLVRGLVLTKSTVETPKSKPKSKKKSKEQALPSYSCDDCDFKAAEIGNLRMHTFYKHGGKTYSCDQCDFKAQRKTGLKFHQSMKHGHYGK